MPRFYIHLRDEIGHLGDDEGIELPDLGKARQYATKVCAALISEELDAGCADVSLTAFIYDARGERLCELPMKARAKTVPSLVSIEP